jgi:aminopeptidase N
MRSFFFVVYILFIVNHLSIAQESATSGFECSHVKSRNAARVTVGDPVEEQYDVKHVKFDLELSIDTTYIAGAVTTTAMVLAPAFNLYVFELNSGLVIDTVLINGVSASLLSMGDIRIVTMPRVLSNGAMFTARVVYHGYPNVASTIFNRIGGLNTMRSPTWRTRVTFTQSEAYHAKEWWPCKQSLRDKIDSVDMWVTVPDTLKAGSNGLLKAVTTIDTAHVRYEWKTKHPIDYYLISVAVAPYVDYSYYMHFSGSTDSMLIQNYVYPNPLTLPFFKSTIDSTGMLLDYFSQIYSRYPFWDEKYGHCMAPLNGGMENQTMTTIGFLEGWVVAHEIGHQWFGDNVTCGTWSDIFVNEGFASYTEDLYREHFHGQIGMVLDMMGKQANVRKYDTGSVYCADTSDEGRVFDSRITYHKGACVLHMLRHAINNDSIFFHVYKTYQQEHKDGTAGIMDFRSAVKSVVGTEVNGINIDTFFRQWLYGEGFPVFDARWNQKGTDVYVQLNQMTKVPASVSCFSTPMEIRLRSTTGDTVIRVNNDRNEQMFRFTWRKTMTGMSLDPNEWVLDSVGSVTKDATLNEGQIPVSGMRVYPNPTSTGWNIDGLSGNCELMLTDVAGRVIWTGNTRQQNASIPAEGIGAGMYFMRVVNEVGEAVSYKLIKL